MFITLDAFELLDLLDAAYNAGLVDGWLEMEEVAEDNNDLGYVEGYDNGAADTALDYDGFLDEEFERGYEQGYSAGLLDAECEGVCDECDY